MDKVAYLSHIQITSQRKTGKTLFIVRDENQSAETNLEMTGMELPERDIKTVIKIQTQLDGGGTRL